AGGPENGARLAVNDVAEIAGGRGASIARAGERAGDLRRVAGTPRCWRGGSIAPTGAPGGQCRADAETRAQQRTSGGRQGDAPQFAERRAGRPAPSGKLRSRVAGTTGAARDRDSR